MVKCYNKDIILEYCNNFILMFLIFGEYTLTEVLKISIYENVVVYQSSNMTYILVQTRAV